jgi:hypothetical protein
MISPNTPRFVVAVVASLLCSCASVTVKDVQPGTAKTPRTAPKRFYVVPFSTDRALVKEHPSRKNPGNLRAEIQQLVVNYTAAELSKNIAPATVVSGKPPTSSDAWIITGEFTRIDEGSRLLRMAIGLGAGRTYVDTRVAVRNASASNPPFHSFATTGTSGAMWGAATNPIPFSGVPLAVFKMQQGITEDSARTARMITAEIADYMVQRGWLAPDKVPKPKRPRP